MNIIDLLLKEFDQETAITRRMLERVPEDKWSWKPHEKSMTMKQLTVHIAELPGWINMALNTSELDFESAPYNPAPVDSVKDLLALFEKSVESGRASLSKAVEADLEPSWTLRSGLKVFSVFTKYEVIRHALAQTIHHRAQLGVYLRLLDIPIPGSYGPSADESW